MIGNSRGQVAAGITWFVATIIIFVMTVLFFFLVGSISGVSGYGKTSADSKDASVSSAIIGDSLARNQLNAFLISDLKFSDSAIVLDYIRGFDFSKVDSGVFNRTLSERANLFFSGQSDWGLYVSERLTDNIDGIYYTQSASRQFSDGKVQNKIPFLAQVKKGQCANKLNYAFYQFNSLNDKKLYVWFCIGGGK
ncbi:MAG: hypothetical protein AABX11_06975 [Nanoarchaeota archaeon]